MGDRSSGYWLYISVILALLLAGVAPAMAQEGGAISETFDSPNPPGWDMSPGAMVEGGVLRVGSGEYASYSGEWTDFTASIRMRLAGEGEAVIGYRNMPSSRYLILIGPGYIILHRSVNDQMAELQGNVASYTPGEWFTLGIYSQGQRQVISINEETVVDFTDTEFIPAGGLGFESLGGTLEVDEVSLMPGAGAVPPVGEPGQMPPPEGEPGEFPPPPEGEPGEFPPPPEGEPGEMPPMGMEGNWFSEDFDEGITPEMWNTQGEWEARDGVLASMGEAFLMAEGEWHDMHMAVRFRMSGDGIVYIFFLASQDGAYTLSLTGDMMYFYLPIPLSETDEEGNPVPVAEVEVPLGEEWHDIEIISVENRFTVWLDGEPVMETGGVDWPPGSLGVATLGEVRVEVDRIEVGPPEMFGGEGPEEPVGPAIGIPLPGVPPEGGEGGEFPPPGMCVVVPSGVAVNLRDGPGTNYNVIGSLQPGNFLEAVGRDNAGDWYAVDANGQLGWVSASVVGLQGECQNLQIVQAPPPPPGGGAPAPPQPPGGAPPPTSAPPAGGAPPTPVPPPAATPAGGPAPTPVPTPTTVSTVGCPDFTLAPNYGSTGLSSGFTPDPFWVSVTAGGNVDASTCGLPASCIGYVTTQPDYRLYWSGASSGLRIFFIGNGDATLIVNGPMGGWNCNDDSDGTLNPMVEWANPPAGQYDIWVGSYAPTQLISGMLYITELNYSPGNPPP